MNSLPEPTTTRQPQKGAAVPKIAVIDLRKSFNGKEILRGVNLDVAEDESLVIVGGSGAGKSVLLKHLIGLMQPDSGHVVVDGEDLACADPQVCLALRRKFGMSFQEGGINGKIDSIDNTPIAYI